MANNEQYKFDFESISQNVVLKNGTTVKCTKLVHEKSSYKLLKKKSDTLTFKLGELDEFAKAMLTKKSLRDTKIEIYSILKTIELKSELSPFINKLIHTIKYVDAQTHNDMMFLTGLFRMVGTCLRIGNHHIDMDMVTRYANGYNRVIHYEMDLTTRDRIQEEFTKQVKILDDYLHQFKTILNKYDDDGKDERLIEALKVRVNILNENNMLDEFKDMYNKLYNDLKNRIYKRSSEQTRYELLKPIYDKFVNYFTGKIEEYILYYESLHRVEDEEYDVEYHFDGNTDDMRELELVDSSSDGNNSEYSLENLGLGFLTDNNCGNDNAIKIDKNNIVLLHPVNGNPHLWLSDIYSVYHKDDIDFLLDSKNVVIRDLTVNEKESLSSYLPDDNDINDYVLVF